MSSKPQEALSVSLWRASGFLINRIWINCFFFSAALFSYFDTDRQLAVLNSVYTSSLSILIVSLAALGIAYRLVYALFDLRLGEYLGPTIVGIGILVLTPFLIDGDIPESPFVYLSSACTGFGSALVVLDVGRSFVSALRRGCVLEVLTASVLAMVIAPAVSFLPVIVAYLLTLTLPFCAIYCVRRSNQIKRSLADRTPLGESISFKMTIRLILVALILGAVSDFIRNLYSIQYPNIMTANYSLLLALGFFVVALPLVGAALRSKYFNLETIYKYVALVIIIGLTLLPVFGIAVTIPYFVVSLGYSLFEIFIWVLLCEVASRFQYTSIQVFGIGRSLILLVGFAGGTILTQTLKSAEPLDVQAFTIVAATSVILITLARSYILTEHHLVSLESASDEMVYDVLANLNEEKAKESRSADDKAPKIPLFARCEIIGRYHLLSPREIDVFHLLATGRNAARIQEELMISMGTVNSHTYHIYQKLNIHTQQELIDLMQNADLEQLQKELWRRDKPKRSRIQH
jgi:DNA-binding CsgD family transcriptional regulator